MSKEKQIEEMAKDVTNSIVWDSDGYATVDCLATAKKLHLKGYRKQSEWISVEERLPDLEGGVRTWGDIRIQPSVRVLCACKQKSGKVFVKEGYCEMWGSRVYWKIPGSIDKVTHWMPLPEPPKNEN